MNNDHNINRKMNILNYSQRNNELLISIKITASNDVIGERLTGSCRQFFGIIIFNVIIAFPSSSDFPTNAFWFCFLAVFQHLTGQNVLFDAITLEQELCMLNSCIKCVLEDGNIKNTERNSQQFQGAKVFKERLLCKQQ